MDLVGPVDAVLDPVAPESLLVARSVVARVEVLSPAAH